MVFSEVPSGGKEYMSVGILWFLACNTYQTDSLEGIIV